MPTLLERHQRVLPSWVSLYYREPIALARGEGCWVWDTGGRRYLDFFGGILTTMTAHALPEVTKAVSEQAQRILHTSSLYLDRPMVELAERIAAVSGIPDARVFFTTSGTEANDTALLLATTYRRSNQIVALRNSYHGRSFSAIGITGNRSWSPTSLSPLQTLYVHGGVRTRGPFAELDDAAFVDACTEDLADMLGQAGGDVAALIAEPVQGVGGFTSGPDGLLAAFREVLPERGVLWISDEVQTGWGRTGEHFWGWQAHGDSGPPDIVTFAKGLGNGLSIGGVIASAEIMNSVQASSLSTFGGSPITTAGALANLNHLLAHDLQGNAKRVGAVLRAELDDARRRLPHVADVRGKGLMIGVELVRPGTAEPDAAAATAVLEHTKSAGLLIGKGGLDGNVLRIAPPLSLTEPEALEGAAILVDALTRAGERS